MLGSIAAQPVRRSDLLLELAGGHLHAVEIKRSVSDPRPSKGFHLACDDLKVRGRWVPSTRGGSGIRSMPVPRPSPSPRWRDQISGGWPTPADIADFIAPLGTRPTIFARRTFSRPR